MSEELKSPTNWPDPNRPGVPLFPDRDGAHAIEVAGLEITDIVYYWHQNGGGWTEYNHQGSEDFLTDEDMQGWIYKGPILTPTQIAELLAGEREKCAREAESHRSKANPHAVAEWDVVQSSTANAIAHAIRNLGAAP